MKRLTTTATQEQLTTRQVADFPALAALVVLSSVVVIVVGVLRTWPVEHIGRVLLFVAGAECGLMAIAPLKAVYDFVWSQLCPEQEEPTGPTTQLVPVNAHRPRVAVAGDGRPAIPPEDLADMIDQLDTRGHSVRAWRGQRLASGHVIRSERDETYRAFIDILVSHGWLEGRTESRAGKLTANKVEIRNALEEAEVL